MITINGLIDSLYIRNLAKETHRGIEGRVLKGYSGGGKRYGYYSVPVYNGKVDIYGNPEADGYILKINPDEANTIIRIFRLFGEDGYSAKRIVNILNKEIKETGEPKPPRGLYWCVTTILGNKKAFRGILNNEIYIGRYHWNSSSSRRNPENGKKKFMAKDDAKWIVMQKPELRIISDELWEKVKNRQRQLKDNCEGKYTKAKPSYSVNLVTGLMTCSQCGGNIVVVSGGKYSKYGCSNNWNKGTSVCSNNSKIKKREIEESIINTMDIDFGNDKIIAYLAERVNAVIRSQISQNNPTWRYDSLEQQLKRVNKEITNFINAIKAGIISDIVKTQLASAEKKKTEIERFLANQKNNDTSILVVSQNVIRRYIENIHATLSLHPVYGRTFLSKIIDNIMVEPFNNTVGINIYCKKDGILGNKFITLHLLNCQAHYLKTESCSHRRTVMNNSHHIEDNLCLI